MKTLESHQNNCFDIIRIFAAFLVLYSHHYALSGLGEPSFMQMESYGGLAVIIFFSVSGYLIAQSGMRSTSFTSYMKKRIRRIFPALIACAFVMYILVGSIINNDNLTNYYTHKLLISILNMIALKGADSLNLAQHYIYPNAINGSLWTLPLEFACYIILAIGFSFSKNHKSILTILLIMITTSIYLMFYPSNIGLYSIALQQFSPKAVSFFMGALLALSKDQWNTKKIRTLLFFSGIIFMYLLKGTFEINILAYIIIPVIIIVIGVSLNDRIIHGKFDYSYGVYIYAFPVQQLVINNLKIGFYPSMILSAIITLICGALSWHLIEERFLKRNLVKS